MNRRTFLAALAGSPALAALIAACGDDSVVPAGSGTGPDPTGGTTGDTTAPQGIAHPTGADDVVLRIGYEGGFVPVGVIFVNTPNVLISGDGRLIEVGATPAIYPGPLLPALMERSIDEAGIQTVLAAAKDAGLLASAPDYSLPDGIGVADASDTVVRIRANGASYEHRAYALGIAEDGGATSTPARENLAAFVAQMSAIDTVVGAGHLGESQPLQATQYRFQAAPVDPAQYSEPSPTLVEWPSGTGVALADATECAVVDASVIGDVFTTATQLTFFTENDVAYQLSAIAVLPGDAPCA